jgi:hypothetical protein
VILGYENLYGDAERTDSVVTADRNDSRSISLVFVGNFPRTDSLPAFLQFLYRLQFVERCVRYVTAVDNGSPVPERIDTMVHTAFKREL